MKKGTRISCIIITYNRHLLLEKAIQSILNQSYRDYEIIVIDDGSNTKYDGNYLDQIRYIYVNHTGNPALVRNIGVFFSNGEYIAFLDSDDEWINTKLEKQLSIMIENNYEISCTKSISIGSETMDKMFPNKSIKLRELYIDEMLQSNKMVLSSLIIKRDVIIDIGLFNCDPLLFAVEDYELSLKMILQSRKILLIDSPFVLYNIATSDKISPRKKYISEMKVYFTLITLLRTNNFRQLKIAIREQKIKILKILCLVHIVKKKREKILFNFLGKL